MRAPSTTVTVLTASLALPVLVSGFQLRPLKMPPNANLMMSAAPEAAVRKRPNASSSNGSSNPNAAATAAPPTAAAPLHYAEDADAVAVDPKSLRPSLTLTPPRGGAAAVFQFAAKSLPIAAAVTALCVVFARYLATLSSPAAQGVKLVYAGAIAGECGWRARPSSRRRPRRSRHCSLRNLIRVCLVRFSFPN